MQLSNLTLPLKKFLQTTLFILVCFVGKPSEAQYYPRIDTLEVIPNSPTIHDNIAIRIDLTIPKRGSKISDSISKSGDTIYVFSHLLNGFQSAFMTFQDTFSVGRLPAGKYFIKLKAKMDLPTSMGDIPWDSTKALDSFVVYDDVSLYEMAKGGEVELALYPNPSSIKQKISLFKQIPKTLKIDLYDISGKKVKEIFNGQSVQGQQEFEADLSHLPQGLYFYHIRVGEEWQYLKTVKQ